MDESDFSRILDDTNARELKRKTTTKMEISIDLSEVMEETQESLDQLKEERLEDINRRMRDHIYKQMLEGGRSTQGIVQMSSNPNHPAWKSILNHINRYCGQVHGIGMHKGIWNTIKEETRGRTQASTTSDRHLHGIEVLFDPRRSRDEALLFRSKKIWKAYRELLNDEVPSFLKSMLHR
jgi:hypothetical protein